ncbi:MAG: hypothetical protein F2873_08605 [Actinobacteria bacterium]|jgi:hypothetical protein|uniref:Unannotated protein n=1 Tax=freshwater metagenome TaxID=449393 RepID=A0A6J7P5M1_9ZZZZ|nr:hypothetical protein [Actinomycetota bacterium]MSX79785.1 hypothetical protein [Actinomycetota bacterium]
MMQVTRLVLSEAEQRLLASLRGSEWVHLSGDMFDNEFLAWDAVRLQCSTSAILIELPREVIDIGGDCDDYAVLHIRPASSLSAAAERAGSVYYQGRGETVRNIWVIRDTVTGTRTEHPDFTHTADVAVVFGLDTMSTSIQRAGRFSDAFLIRRSPTREELSLPDTEDEWESDLLDQYTVSREWIPIV